MDNSTKPSYTVESESQQERILARRNRIAQRQAQKEQASLLLAQKNEQDLSGNNDCLKSEVDKKSISNLNPQFTTNEDPTISTNNAEKTIETSRQSLDDFINQGQSILDDVKIAYMNHESDRRREQERQQREMLERLENEARQEDDKFKEIFNKWDINTSNSRTPQDLNNLLNEQTNSCKQVIEQKNKIIYQLKEVARQADDRYVKDLKRLNNDIELISKRMEEHVKDMTSKFGHGLKKIEETLLSDRKDTLNKTLTKSENSWQARTLREIEMIYLHLEETEKYTKELDEIRQKGSEEYAIIRNKLERDVMTHEQQLQQMKAIYQLNQEKLQYNHEILRNREDENNIIKAQQKRRITKLQDNLNSQRQKLVKQEQHQKNESAQLFEDYQRIVTQHKDLETKMKHFTMSDSKKFHEVWKMNFNTVKQLASECLCADRIIHLQQLGIPCNQEDDKLWFVNSGNLNFESDDPKGSTTSQFENPILAPWQEATIKKSIDIQPLKEEKSNIDEDSSIAPSDINSISNQDVLVEKIAENSTLSISTVRTLLPLLAEEGDFLFEKKLSTLLKTLQSSHSTLIKLDAIFSALGIQTEDDITLLAEHLYECLGSEMDINKVVPALNGYIRKYSNGMLLNSQDQRDKNMGVNSASSLLGNEWAALEDKYWQDMEHVIADKKLHLWDALDQGLEKYYDQLVERRNLIVETDNLKRQNGELRILLQQYLCSKVNKELQIPPTKVLQNEAK